jgi:Helix-turn-helix domain
MPHHQDIRSRFGSRIRQLRAGKGWSQEELADRAGLHRTYIGSIERGEQNIVSLRQGCLIGIRRSGRVAILVLEDRDGRKRTSRATA